MKITKKQQSEIDFFSNHIGEKINPTEKEIEEYIEVTVFGKGRGVINSPMGNEKQQNNPLLLKKRGLDILIKQWRGDIDDGLLSCDELADDFGQHPYILKIIKTIKKKSCQ